jgi:hypothetical protein
MPATNPRTRPIEKFAKAVGMCTVEVCIPWRYGGGRMGVNKGQSSAYGKCIFRDYNNVTKGMCQVEFMRLKECVLVSTRGGKRGEGRGMEADERTEGEQAVMRVAL